jgi:hypothetical protein
MAPGRDLSLFTRRRSPRRLDVDARVRPRETRRGATCAAAYDDHVAGVVVVATPSIRGNRKGSCSYRHIEFNTDDLAGIVVGPLHAVLNRPMVVKLPERYGFGNTEVTVGGVALRTLG